MTALDVLTDLFGIQQVERNRCACNDEDWPQMFWRHIVAPWGLR
jgi:hypothetical protein